MSGAAVRPPAEVRVLEAYGLPDTRALGIASATPPDPYATVRHGGGEWGGSDDDSDDGEGGDGDGKKGARSASTAPDDGAGAGADANADTAPPRAPAVLLRACTGAGLSRKEGEDRVTRTCWDSVDPRFYTTFEVQ